MCSEVSLVQCDKKADSHPYCVGVCVMVYMPSESKGKKQKLPLPYHGPYRILEVQSDCILVRPVDRPDAEPILVTIERFIRSPK